MPILWLDSKVDIVDFRYVGQQEVSNYISAGKNCLGLEKWQVMLMLNRRIQVSLCRDCSYVDECPNCDISLALHMDTKTNCHYVVFKSHSTHCQIVIVAASLLWNRDTEAYDELAKSSRRVFCEWMLILRDKRAHQRILINLGIMKLIFC